MKKQLIVLSLPFLIFRTLTIFFQRESLSLVKPIKQIFVGLANDFFIFALLVLVTLLLRFLVMCFKSKFIESSLRGVVYFLFTFVYLLLFCNLIFVFYTGNNLSFYELGYLKDISWIAGDFFTLIREEYQIFIFVLFSLLLLIPLLQNASFLLKEKKYTKKKLIFLFVLFIFSIMGRSFSLSNRLVLHEPTETNLFTFLSWRYQYDKRHKISYPKEGFNNLKRYKQKIKKQTLISKNTFQTKQNIILLLLESFSFKKIREKPEVAPFLSHLLDKDPHTIGLMRHFTTSYRTIGAQFSLLCSKHDPLEFYVSRDYPRRKKTHCLTHVLKSLDYTTLWVSGQTGEDDYNEEWLSNHGFKDTYSAKDFPNKEREFSYGIHDDYVLKNLLHILDKKKEPFFSYFLSISNHYPYNLPKDFLFGETQEKFKPFEKAYYFTDSQVKMFLQEAQKKSWYKNTLFVILGDHPHWGFSPKDKNNGSDYTHMSQTFQTLALFRHPSFKKENIHKITSHIDFSPTILGLLGHNKRYDFVGMNIFRPSSDRYIGAQDNTRSTYFNLIKEEKLIRCHHSLNPCVTAEKEKKKSRPSTEKEKEEARIFKEMFYDTTNAQFTF